jgi:hypothetical protein
VEGELGEPLLADGADDALHVHLAEAEEEDGAALAVVVVPPAREIVPHHRRHLDRQNYEEKKQSKNQKPITNWFKSSV